MSKSKPDRRLITLVNNTPRYRCGGPLLPTAGTIPLASYMLLVDAYEVVTLLRREQQRVRRMITAHKRKAARERVSYYGLTIDCCNDILEKLKGNP